MPRELRMGHEAIVYGRIVGASWRVGDRYTRTHDLNKAALDDVQYDNEWPWLVRDIFALPAPFPRGTYRQQVIHFGLSIKNEPQDRSIWDAWLEKFEQVLRSLYWSSAIAHLETEFESPRVFAWEPTEAALGRLYDDPPQPIAEWVRTISD
jgi:hypothetical protein